MLQRNVTIQSPRCVYYNYNPRLGCHVQKLPKLSDTMLTYFSSPLRSIQIYISNSRSYGISSIDIEDLLIARNISLLSGKYLVIHSCLLYNPAGSAKGKKDPDYEKKLGNTRRGMIEEMDIGAGLGCGVVVHIGSCKNKKEGLRCIAETCVFTLTQSSKFTRDIADGLDMKVSDFVKTRKLILENAAGEGTKLGVNIDEIAEIFDHVRSIDATLINQIVVCWDTAHSFGAGVYDFGVPPDTDTFYSDFDSKIGLSHLELFHLNDSRVELGSHKDRHEYLTEGYQFSTTLRGDGVVGSVGLEYFIRKAMYYNIPLVCETPGSHSDGSGGYGGLEDYGLVSEYIIPEMDNTVY